jgi:FkbM family methyltransferase
MVIFLRFAKICKSFLDVGANCGYYSICANKANKNLTITASEPNTHTFTELTSNLKLNKIDSVTKLNYALASINSDTENFFVPKFIGSAGGSLSNLHPDDSEIINVKVRTLDTMSQELNKTFDLIKIDIEGSEYEFLKGGQKTIQRDNPIIFVELLRKWMKNFNSKPQIFLSNLEKIGYICYGIGENFLRVNKSIDEHTMETNFIFVPSQNKNALKIINEYR